MATRIIIKRTTVTVTKKMYGWSKYGGSRKGVVREELDRWFCQSCAEEQLKDFPSYMLPLDEDEREYAQICTKCRHTALVNKITTYVPLRQLVRKPDIMEELFKVANLPTLPRKI